MEERTQNLIDECRRMEESCLYTSTTLFEWLKSLRRWKLFFVVIPIVLGGVATWPLLAKQDGYKWVTGICALLAGMAPAIYKALDFDVNLNSVAQVRKRISSSRKPVIRKVRKRICSAVQRGMHALKNSRSSSAV